MSFGSRLKELRIEQNASQKDVADDIGISITAISQYESDSRFPNEETLKRLCLYYKISSDYLLGLTDTKHAPLSKEEIKEKLKIFITRYQAKEAKEQIQYYRKGKISEEERNILKEMEIRIDQLDFDEAEILMKRWEGME